MQNAEWISASLPLRAGRRDMITTDLETRTRQYGRELFARIDRQGPILFTKAWLEDKLMGLGMHDPALKVQLFRFVDTLPYLTRDGDVTRHLTEYLCEAKNDLPWWVRQGMRFIPDGGPLGSGLAIAARTGARQMARKFIAGSNVAEALNAVQRMRTRRLAFTIDLLGEATITEPEADHVQKQYLDLLAGLTRDVNRWPEEPTIDRDDSGPIPRVNVSVKLSALYSQFDPIDPDGTAREVCHRLRPILRSGARDRGVRQLRHGAIRIQGHHPADLPRCSDRAGIPRLASRRDRDPGVPAGHSRRLDPSAPLGEDRAGVPGLGSAGERCVLGLRNGPGGAE
jgi:hypothetical protein